MKTLLLLILFLNLAVPCVTHGQMRQHGLLLPITGKESERCCIYSPKEGFEIVDNPNGKKSGILTQTVKSNTGDQAPYRIFFVDRKTDYATEIALEKFKEIEYEVYCIPYFERRNGFVRIIDSSLSCWIAESEITQKGFRLCDWQQFFIEKSGQLSGFFPLNPELDLKALPQKEAQTIQKMSGDMFEITPTKECIGTWTKVKVIKYKENRCTTNLDEKDNIEFAREGWIEILNGKDQPNLWYYPRGC